MDAATWFLTVKLFAGDPLETYGPYTEDECMRCGAAMYAQIGLLAKIRGRQPGPGWLCLQVRPHERQPEVKRPSPCGE